MYVDYSQRSGTFGTLKNYLAKKLKDFQSCFRFFGATTALVCLGYLVFIWTVNHAHFGTVTAFVSVFFVIVISGLSFLEFKVGPKEMPSSFHYIEEIAIELDVELQAARKYSGSLRYLNELTVDYSDPRRGDVVWYRQFAARPTILDLPGKKIILVEVVSELAAGPQFMVIPKDLILETLPSLEEDFRLVKANPAFDKGEIVVITRPTEQPVPAKSVGMSIIG